MDFEPLALDTRKPPKGSKRPTSKPARIKTAGFTETAYLIIYRKGPLSKHCIYRAKYPDVEIHVHIFGNRCDKNDIKLQRLNIDG